MISDKVFDFVVASVRKKEQDKHKDPDPSQPLHPQHISSFRVVRAAGTLVEPCKARAKHHREREADYTKKLEEAEKELREKGISMEVFDQATGTYQNLGALASGSISSGALGCMTQTFQPRVDQRLLDSVKNAKSKMLDHRGKAEGYERQARAFACNPDFPLSLTVEDVHYFRLEAPASP